MPGPGNGRLKLRGGLGPAENLLQRGEEHPGQNLSRGTHLEGPADIPNEFDPVQ